MNPITQYRQKHQLSQPQFAALLESFGDKPTQGLVSQWEKYLVALTHERCIQIERATGGEIRAESLRDDVIWQRKGGEIVGYTVEVEPAA